MSELSDRYFDPVWQFEVPLSELEHELLQHPFVRRLAHVAHAGAASVLSPQTYSRLDHSLGLFTIAGALRPDDRVFRAAALVHDIGHTPLSHTVERALGLNHHQQGDALVRRLAPVFTRHGLRADDVVDATHGIGPSGLGAPGAMRLDHLESFVRSAHAHGGLTQPPRLLLDRIHEVDGQVSPTRPHRARASARGAAPPAIPRVGGAEHAAPPSVRSRGMAIVYAAALRPTKPELLEAVLGGPGEVLGSYRFDDPAGEVGVEAFVVRRDTQLHHVVLTYRGAPLDVAEAQLISTLDHSVLGQRWVYDGTTDPVAVECFRRALRGEQDQAVVELWEGDRMIEVREPTARVTTQAGAPADGTTVRILRDLDPAATGPGLVANWTGGEAVVAVLAA